MGLKKKSQGGLSRLSEDRKTLRILHPLQHSKRSILPRDVLANAYGQESDLAVQFLRLLATISFMGRGRDV
jgi:hypothetical protein